MIHHAAHHLFLGWSNGQVFAAVLLVLSGMAMAIDIAWRTIARRARLGRSARRHPASRPYDWARECPGLRQAVNVHRRQAS